MQDTFARAPRTRPEGLYSHYTLGQARATIGYIVYNPNPNTIRNSNTNPTPNTKPNDKLDLLPHIYKACFAVILFRPKLSHPWLMDTLDVQSII